MAHVEVDADAFSGDSAYGEELSTYSASLTSSAYQFPIAHGRTYHAYRSGRYFLPNDESESERLDIIYVLARKLMDNKLYLAPLVYDGGGDEFSVLDLATGNGLWAMDFADTHEKAQVLANDLSPTMPTVVPPNLKFMVDDIEAEWSEGSGPFNFIHAGFLPGAIRDWPRLMAQTFKHIKPDGYAEFHDWDVMMYSQDGTFADDLPLKHWHTQCIERRGAMGYDMRPGIGLEGWMKDAGFVDVTVTKYVVPFGTWPKDKRQKELGALNFIQFEEGLEAIGLGTLTNGPDAISVAECQVLHAQARKNMTDRNMHCMYD